MRPQQVSAFCRGIGRKGEDSSKDRLCPQQEEQERLDCLYLYKPGTIRGRDHSDLWKTLADRSVFQDMQVLSQPDQRMSQPLTGQSLIANQLRNN